MVKNISSKIAKNVCSLKELINLLSSNMIIILSFIAKLRDSV
jgi:hypothetical protein